MPLTRPLINNLNTNVEIFNESMTVLHGNSVRANVDIGFVMNRAMGLVPNSAFYWNEASTSFYFVMTGNAGLAYSNITPSSYANVTVGNVLFVNGAGLYVNGSLGTTGQVLGSNGTSLSWVSGGGFNGGTITNALTDTAGIQNTPIGNTVPNSGTFTSLGANSLTITENGTGNQYALTMKGASVGDQWAFTVGNTAGQNNITSLNTAGSSYAPFTINGSTFTVGTTGAGATTSLSIDNTGATTVTGNLTYGNVAVLNSSSTTTGVGATPRVVDSFATATYRGAKYLVSTTDVTNSQYQMSEIVLIQDGANVGISVYGVSYTGTSQRMTFTANIASGILTLYGTGVSANNTVKLQRTLIPV